MEPQVQRDLQRRRNPTAEEANCDGDGFHVSCNERALVLLHFVDDGDRLPNVADSAGVEGVAAPQMVKFAAALSRESIVDVKGVVSILTEPIKSATQQEVEIQVRKLHCVSRTVPNLPINLEDAARSEVEIECLTRGHQLIKEFSSFNL